MGGRRNVSSSWKVETSRSTYEQRRLVWESYGLPDLSITETFFRSFS